MMYDLNIAQGGPILRDKLWFFGSFRNWQIDKKVTNSFAANPDGVAPRFFDPAPERLDGQDGRPAVPGIDDNTITSGLLRLTYQPTPNNKLSAHLDRVFKDRYHVHDANADVATSSRWHGSPIYYTSSAKWTSTLSNRMLLEVGYSGNIENWSQNDAPIGPPTGPANALTQDLPPNFMPCFETPCFSADPNQLPGTMHPWYQQTMRNDIETGYRDRYHWGTEQWRVARNNWNASLSYITGSHNIKGGIMNGFGPYQTWFDGNGHFQRQRYRLGVPEDVRVSNKTVNRGYDITRDLGIYIQDTWTLDRLTLNLGLRWEQQLTNIDPTVRGDTRFVSARSFDQQKNAPNWKDTAPRLGLAYDLFGDASTAVKVSWGRYNAANTTTYASFFHPAEIQYEYRDWFDCALNPADPDSGCATAANLSAAGLDPTVFMSTNGDDYVQDWEIGVSNRADFGGTASRPIEDPNGVERTWVGVLNVGFEREIRQGLSMMFNWYRRDTHDSVITVNRALSFDDYTLFNITNPCFSDPNPGFIGCSSRGIAAREILPVYALNDDKRGVEDLMVMNTPGGDDGTFSEVYNGFEFSSNWRMPGGGTIFGGYTFERNIFTRCDLPDDPNRQLFCDGNENPVPFLHEFKVSGAFPLPAGFQVSGSAQFYPAQEAVAGGTQDQWGGTHRGGELTGARPWNGNINYVVPQSEFEANGLTRVNSFQLPLMPPGALFYDRLTQVDLSVRKRFNMPNGMRWDLLFDIYNIINAQPILNGTNTYGAALGRATSTIQGRFLQIASHVYW